MNIVFTTTTLPRFKGDGQSPFVLEQAVAWKKERSRDGVYILAPADLSAKSDEVIDGVIIHRYHYFFPYFLERLCYPALLPNLIKNPFLFIELPFLFIAQFITLINFIREKKIDFVYAHWVVPQAVISSLVSAITKTPYAVHNHSSDARVLMKIPMWGNKLLRHIIRNARRYFVTNSLLQAESLSVFSNDEKRTLKEKILVMPMGVSNNSKFQISNFKLKYDFGFIGRLTAKKGVMQFLESVATVKTPVRVGIAGTGEELEILKSKIKNLKLENKVDLLGHLDGEQKWKFIESCKAFVFPSIETRGDIEGMPVSLLEALVAGRTVVATSATQVELLPEWNELKPYVYILDAPQNPFSCATILERVARLAPSELEKTQETVSKIAEHYRWSRLIKAYIQKLV